MKDFGLQLWTIRDSVKTEKDFAVSMKRIADMGYKYVHTAGCEIEKQRFVDIVKANGMTICGTHYDFDKICNDIEGTIKLHRLWETDTIGIGGMGGLEDAIALKNFIKMFNEVASIYAKEGFKLSYHNHAGEFAFVEGNKTIMDYLCEGLEPENVSFVLDTCWVQVGGGDVRHWIDKLSGRIDIIHLKDCKRTYYDNDRKKQALTMTEVGNGTLWWEGIIEAAHNAGVKYYVVEQDNCEGDPFDSVKMSAEYLKRFLKL